MSHLFLCLIAWVTCLPDSIFWSLSINLFPPVTCETHSSPQDLLQNTSVSSFWNNSDPFSYSFELKTSGFWVIHNSPYIRCECGLPRSRAVERKINMCPYSCWPPQEFILGNTLILGAVQFFSVYFLFKEVWKPKCFKNSVGHRIIFFIQALTSLHDKFPKIYHNIYFDSSHPQIPKSTITVFFFFEINVTNLLYIFAFPVLILDSGLLREKYTLNLIFFSLRLFIHCQVLLGAISMFWFFTCGFLMHWILNIRCLKAKLLI